MVSPIAATVVAAVVAVSAVVAFQDRDRARISVRDAWATAVAGSPGDALIFMTIVNDGGDDQIVALRARHAGETLLVNSAGDPRADVESSPLLATPGHDSVSLDADEVHVLARDLDWDALTDQVIQLSLVFAQSDAITILVPILPPSAAIAD